jgi:hypothetical protein
MPTAIKRTLQTNPCGRQEHRTIGDVWRTIWPAHRVLGRVLAAKRGLCLACVHEQGGASHTRRHPLHEPVRARTQRHKTKRTRHLHLRPIMQSRSHHLIRGAGLCFFCLYIVRIISAASPFFLSFFLFCLSNSSLTNYYCVYPYSLRPVLPTP